MDPLILPITEEEGAVARDILRLRRSAKSVRLYSGK